MCSQTDMLILPCLSYFKEFEMFTMTTVTIVINNAKAKANAYWETFV